MGSVTRGRVESLLHYDPVTGDFRWKHSGSGRPRNGLAGSVGKNGYRSIMIDGQNHYVHRLVWLLAHGELPERLDHIDGNRLNNSVSNLRPCCQSLNGANAKTRCDSTTGFKGVFYRKDTGRFAAYLTVNYKRKCLGCFDTASEAAAAYADAAKTYFGQYARTDCAERTRSSWAA